MHRKTYEKSQQTESQKQEAEVTKRQNEKYETTFFFNDEMKLNTSDDITIFYAACRTDNL